MPCSTSIKSKPHFVLWKLTIRVDEFAQEVLEGLVDTRATPCPAVGPVELLQFPLAHHLVYRDVHRTTCNIHSLYSGQSFFIQNECINDIALKLH